MNGNDDTPFFMISFGGDDNDAPARPVYTVGSPLWQLQQMSDALGDYTRTLQNGMNRFDNAAGPAIHGQHAKKAELMAFQVGANGAFGLIFKGLEMATGNQLLADDMLLGLAAVYGAEATAGQYVLARDFNKSDRALLGAINIILDHNPDTALDQINYEGLGQMYASAIVAPAIPYFRRQIFERRLKTALAAQAKNDAPAVE